MSAFPPSVCAGCDGLRVVAGLGACPDCVGAFDREALRRGQATMLEDRAARAPGRPRGFGEVAARKPRAVPVLRADGTMR